MLPYDSSSKLLSLREVIGEEPAYGEDRGARGRAGTVRAGGQGGAAAEKSEALSGKFCVVYPS